jgi:hypothetical protein
MNNGAFEVFNKRINSANIIPKYAKKIEITIALHFLHVQYR